MEALSKQYDANSRFLKVTLTDCGNVVTVPYSDKIKAIINAERVDGQSKGFDGEVNEDGTVTVPLHSWMLELDGLVKCDISVIDTATDNNKKLTTTSFDLMVEKAAYGGDDITTDPQYDILVELIEKVEDLENGSADQTYNPLSENAQSGKAVAEAISTVGNAPKNYEKIATITVAPDTDGKLPTSVIFSADTGGKAFELTEFYIRGLIGATDGSSAKANINVNGKAVFGSYTFGSTLKADALRGWYMQWINLGENNGALCIAPAGTMSSTKLPTLSNVNFQSLSGGLILPSFEGYVPISKVEIVLSAGTSKTWTEGSIFELWGVRK